MWISTRGQYGLRALVELARETKPLAIKEIAERQGISGAYLEQILALLRRAGYIKSTRGAFGGYALSKAPNQITTLEVILTLEGSLAPVACVEDSSNCAHVNACGTESLWRRLDATVTSILTSCTVADLLEEAEFKDAVQVMKRQSLSL